jgi:hypothetical protein
MKNCRAVALFAQHYCTWIVQVSSLLWVMRRRQKGDILQYLAVLYNVSFLGLISPQVESQPNSAFSSDLRRYPAGSRGCHEGSEFSTKPPKTPARPRTLPCIALPWRKRAPFRIDTGEGRLKRSPALIPTPVLSQRDRSCTSSARAVAARSKFLASARRTAGTAARRSRMQLRKLRYPPRTRPRRWFPPSRGAPLRPCPKRLAVTGCSAPWAAAAWGPSRRRKRLPPAGASP